MEVLVKVIWNFSHKSSCQFSNLAFFTQKLLPICPLYKHRRFSRDLIHKKPETLSLLLQHSMLLALYHLTCEPVLLIIQYVKPGCIKSRITRLRTYTIKRWSYERSYDSRSWLSPGCRWASVRLVTGELQQTTTADGRCNKYTRLPDCCLLIDTHGSQIWTQSW